MARRNRQTLSLNDTVLAISEGNEVEMRGIIDPLPNYTYDEISAPSIFSSWSGVRRPGYGGPVIVRYKGKYDRTYFLYESQSGSTRKPNLFFYDHQTKKVSSRYELAIASATTDTHSSFYIINDKYGYLYIVCSEDDGTPRIFKSNYPELDNNGTITTTFTLKTNSQLTTYGNYFAGGFDGKGERLVLQWRGNESNGAVQEQRCFSYSDDYGQTYTAKQEYVSFNNNYWAYGNYRPDLYRGGSFFNVYMQYEPTKAHLAWGVLWTKDYQNFGNLEYYATDGASGWSKNVITNGPITHTEFLTNVANVYVNDTTYSYNPSTFFQFKNGDIIVMGNRSTHNPSIVKVACAVSYYEMATNTWTHNECPIADFPSAMHPSRLGEYWDIYAVDRYRILMLVTNNAFKSELWKSIDGGLSWSLVEDLSSGTQAYQAIFIEDRNMSGADNALAIVQSGTDKILMVQFGDFADLNTHITPPLILEKLTTTQRNNISNVPLGHIIYNTTTNKHQGWNGSAWNDLY